MRVSNRQEINKSVPSSFVAESTTMEETKEEEAAVAVVEEQPIKCIIKYKSGSDTDEFIEFLIQKKLNVKLKTQKENA